MHAHTRTRTHTRAYARARTRAAKYLVSGRSLYNTRGDSVFHIDDLSGISREIAGHEGEWRVVGARDSYRLRGWADFAQSRPRIRVPPNRDLNRSSLYLVNYSRLHCAR